MRFQGIIPCRFLRTIFDAGWGVSSGYTSGMIPIGSHPAWHPVMETLAYASGYALYRRIRRRRGDVLGEGQRWNVIAAAAVGALVGSRLLGLAEVGGGADD